MVNAAIVEDVGASLGQKIQPTFGYYRQANGWITISPVTRMEMVKYIYEGWECLVQYGVFDMTPYVANHPFEGLVMMGGVHEMPVDQLLQTGLYLNPPMVPGCKQHITQFHRGHNRTCWFNAKPMDFPQLVGIPNSLKGPFPCDICQRKDLATAAALAQHQKVAHHDELGVLQMGATIGTSLGSALKPATAENTSGIVELQAQIQRLREDMVSQKTPAKRRPRQGARKTV